MKRLFSLTALCLMLAAAVAVAPAHASKPDFVRLNQAEVVRLPVTASIKASGTTVATSDTYAVSPVKGWLTGMQCVVDGQAATTTGTSPTLLMPKIGGVSATAISLTVVSGTTVGTSSSIVVKAKDVSTTNAVNVGQPIQVLTGAVPGNTTGLNSNNTVHCVLSLTPNYY